MLLPKLLLVHLGAVPTQIELKILIAYDHQLAKRRYFKKIEVASATISNRILSKRYFSNFSGRYKTKENISIHFPLLL